MRNNADRKDRFRDRREETREEAPELELSEEEERVTQKYEQSDAGDGYDGALYRA